MERVTLLHESESTVYNVGDSLNPDALHSLQPVTQGS